MIATASQTIGPFWHALAERQLADLTRLGVAGDGTGDETGDVIGDVIELSGQVFDGSGAPITDACVELWQASPSTLPSWGRCATDAHGGFAFRTVAPDAAAPYLAVAVLARGLVKPLWTRVYLADTRDALLAQLPAARRVTLLAQPEPPRWRWDIRLQGDRETVFLDF